MNVWQAVWWCVVPAAGTGSACEDLGQIGGWLLEGGGCAVAAHGRFHACRALRSPQLSGADWQTSIPCAASRFCAQRGRDHPQEGATAKWQDALGRSAVHAVASCGRANSFASHHLTCVYQASLASPPRRSAA